MERIARAYVGVDEVGWGAIAGPLVVGAVRVEAHDPTYWRDPPVRDSKKLSAEERIRLAELLQADPALRIGYGIVSVLEMQGRTPMEAWHLAARRATAQVTDSGMDKPYRYLIDGANRVDGLNHQEAVPRGEDTYWAIAAASVLAKVFRDRLMAGLHQTWPQYGWDKNKGYPTPAHIRALTEHGLCLVHHRPAATQTALRHRKAA